MNRASRIVWAAPSSGTYYLQVKPYATYLTGTYTLSVTSGGVTPTAALTVDVLQTSISEPNGTSQATVTRSTGTSGVLTVNLSSSDTTEATVPLQVTIPDGSNSATFTVSAQDDVLADGPQTVTISAAAAGFTGGSDTVQVLDNEGGAGDDHGNNASTATTIAVPSTTAGTIGVGSDTDWFRFTATAGTQYVFETTLGTLSDSKLQLIGTDGVSVLAQDDDSGPGLGSRIAWTATSSGTYYVEVLPYSSSYTGSYTLTVSGGGTTPGTTLTVDILQTSISEVGGTSQATVTRGTGTAGNLVVNLTSSDTTEATVLSPVTIPNGSNSITFTVTAVDDTLIDGAQTVTITASVTGYTSGSDTVQVLDNEGGGGADDHGNNAANATPVAVPSVTGGTIETVSEQDWFRFNATAGTQYTFETKLGTLGDSRLELIDVDGVTVLIHDDDSGEGSASKIEWQAERSGTYYLRVKPYDERFTGTYSLLVSGGGVTPGPRLIVDIPQTSIVENGGVAQGTVTRSTGTVGELVVNLSSSDTTEARVPAQVTILNGSNSVTFVVTGEDDTVVDGAQTVTIAATAAGYSIGSDTLQVLDNEGGTGGDDHGNNATVATGVNVPSVTAGTIEVGTDTDWFRVTATAGTQYTFQTTLGTLSDTVLALYNSNGTTLLVQDDDSGEGLASRIDWTAPSSGTYYLQVRPYSTSLTGTYTLSLSGGGVTPGPSLMLNVVQTSISEPNGTSQATVTRSTGTTARWWSP